MVTAESMMGLEEAGRGLLVGTRSATSMGEDWWRGRQEKREKGEVKR